MRVGGLSPLSAERKKFIDEANKFDRVWMFDVP